jgi:outer membrane immunogenic protein
MKAKSLASQTAILSLLLAGSAAAADMRAAPLKAPPRAVAPVATYSWTGCYLGAGGGYGMYNQDVTLLDDGIADSPRVTYGGRGWFGTVQGGCDYQVAPSIVIGAFGDYDFSGMKGDLNVPGEDLFGREKLKSSWAVGGRIGWLPLQQQNFMVFVSGGYTQAKFGEVNFVDDGGVLTGDSLARHTYSGWFIGTGYEYVLGWFPGLTWKTEYRFADYGKENVRFLFEGVATDESIESRKYVHTVRSALVWRFNFGGGGPVMARY